MMRTILTATHHTLDFNSLPSDKFEHCCYWLVEESGEYETVEHYGGPEDKNRDLIGHTYDGELDYFQCKRQRNVNYSLLKIELDGIARHVRDGNIRRPRRIYFVSSSPISPSVKDKLKHYAGTIGMPEPNFWEPVVLDKKVRNNRKALKNFFNVSIDREELLPQVDVYELVAPSTGEYRFTVVNNGEVPAIDCSWRVIGFAWGGYPGSPSHFNLNPQEKRNLRISRAVDFMKKNPIKELRIHFEYRDVQNNWYFSEILLKIEEVPSRAFFRIHPEPGEYKPAQPLIRFSIDSVEPRAPTGSGIAAMVTYTYNGQTSQVIMEISFTLIHGIWKFTEQETEYAIRELAERKISQMIRAKSYKERIIINSDLMPTQETGFEAYKKLRESL